MGQAIRMLAGHPEPPTDSREESMLMAITREISPSLASCELSFVPRVAIDLERAAAQHLAYRQALIALGCRVETMAAMPDQPDSVFVEDVALVLDEVAVMTRPGAASRREEGAAVAGLLGRYRTLLAIEAPGTLDGGDILRLGRRLHVGQSARSNAEGIAQLRTLLRPYGYNVQGVPTRDCLHLKSAVTQLADDCVLLQPAWVDAATFSGLRIIEVHPDEPHAANVVRIGDSVLMPACFPLTRQRVVDTGIDVVTVDVSELQKAEGAVTCCSLVFNETAC